MPPVSALLSKAAPHRKGPRPHGRGPVPICYNECALGRRHVERRATGATRRTATRLRRRDRDELGCRERRKADRRLSSGVGKNRTAKRCRKATVDRGREGDTVTWD